MKEFSNKKKTAVKIILGVILAYLLIGFAFEMQGEMCMAGKYSGSQWTAFRQPIAYMRAAVSAPFWPVSMKANVRHFGTPLYCPESRRIAS